MKPWIRGGVSVAALIAIPCTGWSLTAQEAWMKWQEAAASYGQTMTNDGETTSGGTLTVIGVEMSSDMDGTVVAARIDEVVFAEQDDGSVAITMSESIPMTLNGTDSDTGEVFDVALGITQSGLQMTASEAQDGSTAFAYVSDSLVIATETFRIDDADFPLDLSLTLGESSGSYSVASGPDTSVQSEVRSASAALVLRVQDPEGDGTLDLEAGIADIAATSTSIGAPGTDSTQMAQMIADGFAIEGNASYGPVAFTMAFEEDDNTAQADGSLSGGNAAFAMGADGLSYDVSYQGLDLKIAGSEIPFPQITVKADNVGTAFAIPTLVDEAASPFGMRTAIEGLQVGEEIWSMFDPGAVLPRDPATLVVDIAGTGSWDVDIFDPEAMTELETEGTPPGEIETIDLREARLSFAGAELSGSGSFTVDNTDLETFGGVPRPEGKANFRLVGGNALLDKLATMGLVPPDQVMMVRMMTGMLARPGAGGDELLSEIVIDGDGQLLINGAPMPF